MDSHSGLLISIVVGAAFLLLVACALYFFRTDKNFSIALIFAQACFAIVAATWGSSWYLEFTARAADGEIQGGINSGTPHFLESIIGMAITGIFSALMMFMRHSYNLARLRKS
jgi:lysylphosphatidylglycerol synthetase-like protein (DUF2156 family)